MLLGRSHDCDCAIMWKCRPEEKKRRGPDLRCCRAKNEIEELNLLEMSEDSTISRKENDRQRRRAKEGGTIILFLDEGSAMRFGQVREKECVIMRMKKTHDNLPSRDLYRFEIEERE